MIVESFARWLADYYLLATLLLLAVLAAGWVVSQPARRVALTRATLVGLVLLALLCALPGWSVVHLLTRAVDEAPVAIIPQPMTTENVAVELPPVALPMEAAPISELPNIESPPIASTIEALAWSEVSASEVALIAYFAGILVVVAWQLLRHRRARALVRSASPASAELQRMLNELRGAAALSPPPPTPPHQGEGSERLLISPNLPTAVALGILRPTILLPQRLVESTDSTALRTIIAHELAHIRHGDLRLLALCRALFVLLWANPLFWLLRRRLRLDQETLADAAAAEVTTRHQYAEQLVDWAKRFATDRPPALAAAVGLWESPSQLRHRIAVLLDERMTIWRECSRRWRIASLAVCAGVAVGLSLVTLEPGLAEPEKDGKAEKENQLAKVMPSTAAAPNPQANIISGRCVDEDGKPLSGVKVVLLSTSSGLPIQYKSLSTKTTGAEGAFRFDQSQEVAKEYPDGVPERFPFAPKVVYTVLAQAEGRAIAHSSEVLERVGRSGHFVVLKMPPAAKLTGTVTDNDGKPTPGVEVSVGQMSLQPGVKLFSDVTDEKGEYEINSLQPWRLEDEKKQQGDQFLALEVTSASGTLVSANRTVTFTHPDYAMKRVPYERVPGKVDAQLQPAVTIEGRVVDAGGQPVGGAVVRLTSMYKPKPVEDKSESFKDWLTQNHQAQTKTNEDGRYQFNSVPANDYRIRVEAPELVSRGVDDMTVKTGAEVTAPQIVMSKGGLLRIQCVDAKTGDPFTVLKNAVAGIGDHWHTMPEMLASRVSCTENGVIELQIAPGKHRISVSMLYSPDGFLGQMADMENLPVVDVKEGETVEIRVPVVSAEALLRGQSSRVDPNSEKITEAAKLNAEHKPRKALKVLDDLLQKDPKNLEALLTRTWSQDQLGEYRKVIEDYERIINTDPTSRTAMIAYNNWAYILATSNDETLRNGKRAVELAEQAMHLAQQPTPDLLDTLAAAFAEAGDFEKAIEAQNEAIKLAPDHEEFRKSLKLYEVGKPRRGPSPLPKPSSDE